ncbi:hypothetical protein D3C77_175940 [compost metagenome]
MVLTPLVRVAPLSKQENEMGEINIPRSQQDALKAIDVSALDEAIDGCIAGESAAALQRFRLSTCGPYVANHLRVFERAVTRHGDAKSAKKRAETEYELRTAGDDLAHAVSQMKHRLEVEAEEGLHFYVEDQFMQPTYFTEKLSAQVSYRWRRSTSDGWEYGTITFTHQACSHLRYVMPSTSRKPSAAKQNQDLQDKLRREWEHLMSLGLQAVRDYFREGRNGSGIPAKFKTKENQGLNNFSCDFWAVGK